MTQYNQLTYEKRCQTYALKGIGMSQNKISKKLNVNQSTISRELARNTGSRGYRFKQAQKFTEDRRSEAYKALKLTTDLIDLIEEKLRNEWSPEQISGWLREYRSTLISHETIYKHI
jgi:IS30 family transposase